jgi:hypothetical protein
MILYIYLLFYLLMNKGPTHYLTRHFKKISTTLIHEKKSPVIDYNITKPIYSLDDIQLKIFDYVPMFNSNQRYFQL